ncbi:Ldh family oxidoreductase [Roseivirga spongicola]|uniref:Ldh family oxidoreductase n=1 Tax=Roseivirga spongicola TaxID=333140 RepID=UPI002AC9520A|nr:Ldh family oxidoreductase [Roseivirga spongicola]WPZ08657.1 Ldh family oxidoreductase [Roseivirga spongicola]
MNHFSYDQLYRFSKDIFIAMGCPESDAETATKTLLSADMRGVDSHGVARLSGYVRLWDKQRINAKPDIKVIHETPSTATIDGDAGLGLVVAPFAMQVAIEKAKNAGTGWVAVKNSNHYGIAGYHAMKALDHDMIGMSMTNASPLVSPTFSKERMLGTNPIAVAIPANEQPPFVGDFATTPAANGKLEVLMRKGENAPLGWIQDQGGQSTDNAHGIKEGGSWLPLGGDREHGSHKGFILGSIVDIFSAVLSGANYGPWAPPFVAFLEPSKNPVGEGLGHFFGAMRVDAFRPAEEFKSHMDNWITRFRESDRADENQPVVIPGDPERAYEKERSENGIPLLEPVEKDLRALGERFGVKF